MKHLDQLVGTSHHLDMPVWNSEDLLGCIKHLVNIDNSWFPDMDEPGQFYVRMNHISTDERLGVTTPFKTKLVAILNPTTLKHKNLAVKCSVGVNKNWPLGHGQYTCSGNIGPLMPTVADAKENGFNDVLWLLDDFVQEMTVFNIFFVVKNRYGTMKLYTPMDNGCIMSGVTRQSIIDMKEQIATESGM